jgi:hypothetical protein
MSRSTRIRRPSPFDLRPEGSPETRGTRSHREKRDPLADDSLVPGRSSTDIEENDRDHSAEWSSPTDLDRVERGIGHRRDAHAQGH